MTAVQACWPNQPTEDTEKKKKEVNHFMAWPLPAFAIFTLFFNFHEHRQSGQPKQSTLLLDTIGDHADATHHTKMEELLNQTGQEYKW